MNIGIGLQTGWGNERHVLHAVVKHMDAYLSNSLKNKYYGGEISEWVIMAYAVFPDDLSNTVFSKITHKVQEYQEFYGNHDWFKSMVFTLPFNPERIAKMGYEEFRDVFCKAILACLERPEMKMSHNFEYEQFKQDVKAIIRQYAQKAM